MNTYDEITARLIDGMKKHGMTDQEIMDFAIASNHPYTCRCELCIKWWERMGPEPAA